MSAPGVGGAAEAVPGSAHHKPHSGHPHGQHHAHQQQQHGGAGFGGAHAAPAGAGVLPGTSAAPKYGAGAATATLGAALHDMAAAARRVPGPAPAGAPAAALLPPASVNLRFAARFCLCQAERRVSGFAMPQLSAFQRVPVFLMMWTVSR